jgi:hypothetical protein
MTAPGHDGRCPACGSDETQPFAVILGAAETYGYQCLACAATWTVISTGQDPGHRYHAVRESTDGKQEEERGRRHASQPARGRSLSPSAPTISSPQPSPRRV